MESLSQIIEFEQLNNTRDLGGMITKDGRVVKSGKLIRSGQLFFASEKDREKLSGMVETIVDFRTDQELYEKPDPLFPDVDFHHITILSSWMTGITWEEKSDISEAELFDKLRRTPELCLQYMQAIYGGFVANDYYVAQYRKFVKLLLKERSKALLWHCTAGKDRAGFASVIVEELLGIDREQIIADYLLTAVYLKEEIGGIVAKLKKEYADVEEVVEKSMQYLFGAERAYIEATYRKADEMYGGFETFLKDGLKITKEERYKLQKMYLED